MSKGGVVKSRKQMRNIFIKKIDDILINYYKAVDFSMLASFQPEGEYLEGETYRKEAMKLIEFMRELELLNGSEYLLLRDVYGEYFSIHSR